MGDNVMERMTWDEIAEKYPMQWVGLSDVIYIDNDGISIESAIVKYIDKSKSVTWKTISFNECF
jgi:hypothetical protein